MRAGQVGFGRDMGATRSLLDDDEPGQAITATQAAQAECEAGLNDPLRRYKLWRKVPDRPSSSAASLILSPHLSAQST